MQLRSQFLLSCSALVACMAGFSPALVAQTSIQLFGPVDVRLSTSGTGYGAAAVNFNTANLNLTCPASGIQATLSSTPDNSGYVLVDNNINVTVTQGAKVTGPTNVCIGGVAGSPVSQTFPNCFASGYQQPAMAGTVLGVDPDTLLPSGGVPPISISTSLVPGQQQVTIAEQDEGSGSGFYLAAATLYLNTNCTQGGVTGPALVTGNPISSTNPPSNELTQSFAFNPITNQLVGFQYDLGPAQQAGTLSITDQTIPQVADSPLDPSTFQTVWAPGTSFATSICLVHSGELLPNGSPACKLYTLECTVGTGATASGAQCPVSTVSNEVLKDIFDGPAFNLSDIPTPGGPTFHEGIGFLMASEGWTGGPCTFDPAANLTSLPCPQNLLTSFSGPGTYDGAARTTHPNSTFLSIAQVPEDLTTVTVTGQLPGGWINKSTASVTLSSQPPVLAGTTLPNAASFVASPIQTITYGISPASSVPVPSNGPVAGDIPVANNITCPTLAAPTGIPAAVFTTPVQTITNLADGYYLLHYFAQDCAGTQELKFTQDASASWSTNFYTYAINVDTTVPVVTSGPTLSPAAPASGSYTVGQAVTASYSCSDSLSGVTKCGATTYGTPVSSTPTLTSAVDTSTPGSKSFTVLAVDAASNQASSTVNYTVVNPYDSQIQLTLSPSTVTYPGGSTLTVTITPSNTPAVVGQSKSTLAANSKGGPSPLNGHAPPKCKPATGSIQVLDGTKVIQTLRLDQNGKAVAFLQGLAAGSHSISVVYSGDANTPAGTSAPATLTVLPAPVKLQALCGNINILRGNDFVCAVYANAENGGAQGVITYQYDSAAPVTIPLEFGFAVLTVKKPSAGSHTVTINYAGQGSYLAAPSLTEKFTVK